MALNVFTDKPIMVVRRIYEAKDKTYVNYSTPIVSKNFEGNKVTCYVSIKFPPDVDIPHHSKIKILDGFIAFNPLYKNGSKYPYVYIRNYELIEVGKESTEDGSAFEDFDNYSFI